MIDVLTRAAQLVLQAALLIALLAIAGVATLRFVGWVNRRRYEQRMDLNGAWRTSPLGRVRILERGGTTVVHFVERRERDAAMRAGGAERAS